MLEMSPEDKAQVDRQNAEYQKEIDRVAYAYAFCFRGEAGAIVLKDLRERCNVDCSCVHDGDVRSPDPYAVMLQEGKRCVYNHIINFMRHDNDRRKRQNN